MSLSDEESFERALALEGKALEHLGLVAADALEVVKKDASLERAIGTISPALAEAVVGLRLGVREAAAFAAAQESGLAVLPSGADDSERGERAAAYYVKAWSEALRDDYGAGDWPAAVETAKAAAHQALADVAAFETFDAWNDEHCRAAAALGEKAAGRWTTKRDGDVCPLCDQLHGKRAGRDGLFELPNGKRGRPPLHKYCRCHVTVKALEEDDTMSKNLKDLPVYPETDALVAQVRARDGAASTRVDAPGTVTRALHVKAIDSTKRTVDFVASTDVVDAHDEIVDQGSWVLDDYLKNPVVLFAHDAKELPIGRAVDVAVRNGGAGQQLEARIEFVPEEMNPKAEQVFRMLQAGYLRAVSVGFVPRSYRYEMRDSVEIWVWADCVLKEISVTPVPANPEALAKMKSLAPRAQKHSSPAVSGSNTNHETTAAPPRKDTAMTEKEIQEKLEKQAATIALHDSEQKALVARAEKAEAQLADAGAKLKALETDNAALDAQAKTLSADRDAEKARADKAEGELIDLEVETLVGKKITPAEKPLFVDLRKSNPELFAKMIEQRQPLKLDASVTEKGAVKNGSPAPLDRAAAGTKALDLIVELGSK